MTYCGLCSKPKHGGAYEYTGLPCLVVLTRSHLHVVPVHLSGFNLGRDGGNVPKKAAGSNSPIKKCEGY